MIKGNLKLGYEVVTGKEICIKPAHLVVTGVTQLSGKTTTLQALIKRGNFKAIIFKTKIGEKGITEGTIIPPYYKEEFDWEYASELLEASRKEKLKFERSWIIKYSKTASNILEFKANIDKALADDVSGVKKMRELDKSVLITLQAYLEKILPELQYAPLSKTLDIQEGINIMDLERFKEETQSLIIRSVLEEILKHYKNTIVVIPEAWRYLPEGLATPVKRPAEAFIRQGATNNNFLWIDSQDITGTSKSILKQVSNWILGYQSEINEIKRTLDQIPLPKRMKPLPEDIATLQVGHFFVATAEFTKKVYVQAVWVDDKTAKDIAKGKKKVDDLEQPQTIAPYSIQTAKQEYATTLPKATDLTPIRKELAEMRNDFFNKIQEQQQAITKIYSDLFNLKNQPKQEINIDEIISKVLQKVPTSMPDDFGSSAFIGSKEDIIKEVLARVPKVAGAVTYEVAPLEKLQKDILKETKQKLLTEVASLNEEQKKILKYIEASGKAISYTELTEKCLMKSLGGPSLQKTRDLCKEIANKGLLNDAYGHGKVAPRLKDEIKRFLFNAPDTEIEQVYNHILMEMLK